MFKCYLSLIGVDNGRICRSMVGVENYMELVS
jgi:hypothetical protein